MAPGINTVTWDLRYPSAASFPGMILWGGGTTGPAAVPGQYTVRLTVDGKTTTQPLIVRPHPLHKGVTQADYQAQFDLAIQVRDKVSEANNAVIQIRRIKQDVADRLSKSTDAGLKAKGDALTTNLSAVEGEIYQVRNQSGQDPLNFPIKINNRLASLLEIVESGDAKPIGNALPIFRDLSVELKVLTDRLKSGAVNRSSGVQCRGETRGCRTGRRDAVMRMRRRAFVRALAGTVGAMALPRIAMAANRLDRIGLELYSVRNTMKKDPERTLAAIRAIGYTDVELLWSWNNFGPDAAAAGEGDARP